jgi:hypothetical protein
VLRNLFEEVGWERDVAEHPVLLRSELRELRRPLDTWELLDQTVAAAQPRRSWTRRAIDWLTGKPVKPVMPVAAELSSSDGDQLGPTAGETGQGTRRRETRRLDDVMAGS